MWYLCEKVSCQGKNKKQVTRIKIFTIPGALLSGQFVQLQVSHKYSLSMLCSGCCSMTNPAALVPGWEPDGQKKPEHTLHVHFCFRRNHLFVPIANSAYLSESKDLTQPFFWICCTVEYPFIIQLLIPPWFICLFAHVAVQSHQNRDQGQKAIFSTSCRGNLLCKQHPEQTISHWGTPEMQLRVQSSVCQQVSVLL